MEVLKFAYLSPIFPSEVKESKIIQSIKDACYSLEYITDHEGLIEEHIRSFRLIRNEFWEKIRLSDNVDALSDIMIQIKDEGYVDHIKLQKEMTQEERQKLDNKRKSNSEKLSVANSWLPKLVRNISGIEDPTHEKVLSEVQEVFPDFDGLPVEPELSFVTGTGEINKTSVDKALTFLFNNKHPVSIKEGTIKKRGDKLNWWENGK